MTHDDLVRHLTYYVDLALKDFGPRYGRDNLQGNLPVWEEAYGKPLADHIRALINVRLNKLGERPL